MKKTPNKLKLVRISIIVLVLLVSLMEFFYHPLDKIIRDRIFDGKANYLSCKELPVKEDVEKVLTEHGLEISAIKSLDPSIEFNIGKRCNGKGEVKISYRSRETRKTIQAIINSERFFGMPYRLNEK